MTNGSSFPLPVLLAFYRTLKCGRHERVRIPAPLGVLGMTLLLALTLALQTAAVSAMPSDGNNREAAKACQKGKFANLATSEDPYTAFTTEEACVSYSANGGVLTAFVPLSLGCTALNDPSLDGTSPYLTVLTAKANYYAGETISLTAGGPADAAGYYFYLYAEAPTTPAIIPGTLTHTFPTDQSVQVRWFSVGLPTPIVNWTVSCGR
jgi:hypothetical protein